MTGDLFSEQRENISEVNPQVFLLPGFASTKQLIPIIEKIAAQSPFRQMMTPMGKLTRASMTNCGPWGWTSDRKGYRYSEIDPLSSIKWPSMPQTLSILANTAAEFAGFKQFTADACLINRYAPGDSMGAHQDKDERDFSQPIVSVSLGLTAQFLIYGESRRGPPLKVNVESGDVIVFGGKSRLMYHGVAKIKADKQAPYLKYRYNITLRKSQ